MSAARIYLMDVAEDLYYEQGEDFRNIGEIVNAMIYMLPYAFKEYFLSIPNPSDVEYFDQLMDGYTESSDNSGLDAALKGKQSYDWCRTVYNYCLSCLGKTFGEWEVVSYRIIGTVMAMVSSGDHRIHAYHLMHGHGRVEARDFKPAATTNVADPFFVADSITPEIDESAYEVAQDEHISDLEIATYPDKYSLRGERIFVMTDQDIVDSLVLKEPFDYSRIDEETKAEIERLKSYNSGFSESKLDAKTLADMEKVKKENPGLTDAKACYDVVCARRRRKHGPNSTVIRTTWSFSAEQQRLRDIERLRSKLD